jgi:hypothetical protein
MDPKTLLLIPGVIYGVGLADLLKAFKPKIYWEITVMAILLILTLIINWFLFSEKLEIVGGNLGLFALSLITPMLFTRACNVLTPGVDIQNTREHYHAVLKPFFLLLATHTLVNVLIQTLIEDDGFNILRLIGIPFLLVCAFYHRLWMRLVMMLIIGSLIIYVFTVHQLGYNS